MTRGGSSNEALAIGSSFMSVLGPLFPAQLKLSGEELDFVFVLPDSPPPGRGPRDHPLVEIRERIRKQFGSAPAGPVPRFVVDSGGGRCARLRVELTGTAVRAIIVPPEEVTAQSLPAPFLGRWQDRMPTTVQLALDEITRVLARCHHRAGGAEPLIELDLHYRPERDFAALVAGAHEPVRRFIAPVRPVLRMRWPGATPLQREVFADDVGPLTTTGKWPRRRLTARVLGLELELPAWPARRLGSPVEVAAPLPHG
ncbi:hypothetical protein [Amycolatopsis magusensis]|uniref:hypothetical protein n=1 Tax=Amycolatopsis magusensis TaxID=882444 RepID=UPI0024A8C275|nr:hypothetical protein [Amycolatopsis magusensis]MDI5975021.1 hypothetical protein [Amycolatopsis magusensis]